MPACQGAASGNTTAAACSSPDWVSAAGAAQFRNHAVGLAIALHIRKRQQCVILPSLGANPLARTHTMCNRCPLANPFPLLQMLEDVLDEEFKKEGEQKEGVGKQFNETVASSEVRCAALPG